MERWPAGSGLAEVVKAGVDRWSGGALPLNARPRGYERYCRRVAEYFDRAPMLEHDVALARRYHRFRQENLAQYQAILDAGVIVRPWLGAGQPYRGARDLCSSVRSTGELYVYLTRDGHGPDRVDDGHPMRGPSGIVVDGVEFLHNDVFRAVHDIFGHVLPINDFSAPGELTASLWQLAMYSPKVHPVLFTEQIAQTCWYFFGPHLDAGGRRRYPEQKVFEFPRDYLADFLALFTFPPTEEST